MQPSYLLSMKNTIEDWPDLIWRCLGSFIYTSFEGDLFFLNSHFLGSLFTLVSALKKSEWVKSDPSNLCSHRDPIRSKIKSVPEVTMGLPQFADKILKKIHTQPDPTCPKPLYLNFLSCKKAEKMKN
jgi:hypothetical protein